jgi:hypothetical protein
VRKIKDANVQFNRLMFWHPHILREPNSIIVLLFVIYNYHLFTETEGNSVFCGPKSAIEIVARGEVEGNNGGRGATKHTAFPRSQQISVLLYSI